MTARKGALDIAQVSSQLLRGRRNSSFLPQNENRRKRKNRNEQSAKVIYGFLLTSELAVGRIPPQVERKYMGIKLSEVTGVAGILENQHGFTGGTTPDSTFAPSQRMQKSTFTVTEKLSLLTVAAFGDAFIKQTA